MRDQSRTRALAELAGRQHGAIAHWQLVNLGFSTSAIGRMVAAGRLHRVFRGVYAVGHQALPLYGRSMAAVLACGSDAALSYRSAAELWGLRRTSRYVIDVTVPRRIRAQLGIQPHFARWADTTVKAAIPVTTVEQTLLDLAEVLSPRWLERAWDQAERLELLDLRKLTGLLTRSPGRRGLKPLTELIATAVAPEPTKSELEDMLRDICIGADLPPPAFNATVAGEEVDAFWAGHGFVVEVDGWQHHRTRADRERDLLKEERIKLAGYRFMRFSYRRIERDPAGVAAVLRRCLDTASMLT